MASPQLENGFTRISNEILEAIYRLRLNGTQYRIIMFLLRYTYGFRVKECVLSEGFISKGTGIDKANVSKELKKLVEYKIVNVISGPTYTQPRILSFNKNHEEWLSDYQQLSNDQQLVTSPTPTVVSLPTPTVGELTTNKRKHINKTNKENIYSAFFNSLWELYPCKKGKSKVTKKAIRELHDLGYETIKGCIDRYKATKPDWQEWQHGSTFFNGGYKDYLGDRQVAGDTKTADRESIESIASKLGLSIAEYKENLQKRRNC